MFFVRHESPTLAESSDYESEIQAYLKSQRREDRLSRHGVVNRERILQRFFEWANVPRVALVTPNDAQRFYNELRDVKEETRQCYVRWLRVFFKWLVEHRRLRENPFSKVRMGRMRPTARRSTLTKAQVDRLLADAAGELAFVLYCGFHAGMRKEEVIEARPEWFDLNSNHIHIGPTATWIPKDRERRSVPITSAFRAFLDGYGVPSPYMLAPESKRGRSRYRYEFRKPFLAHLKKHGIECSFHDARRTFASLLVSAGVSVYKVARWLGDGVGVVEKHYGHLQPDNGDLERALG